MWSGLGFHAWLWCARLFRAVPRAPGVGVSIVRQVLIICVAAVLEGAGIMEVCSLDSWLSLISWGNGGRL